MAGKRLSLARHFSIERDRRVRFGSRKVLRCTVITSGRGAFWVLAILVVSTARMRWGVLLRSTPSKNNTGEGRLERCHAIREGFF